MSSSGQQGFKGATDNGEQQPGFKDNMKAAMQDAAPRMLATQITNIVRRPLAKALARASGTRGRAVEGFLEGEVGSALVRFALARIVTVLPVVPEGYREVLRHEFDTSALERVGNLMLETISKPIADVFAGLGVMGAQVAGTVQQPLVAPPAGPQDPPAAPAAPNPFGTHGA